MGVGAARLAAQAHADLAQQRVALTPVAGKPALPAEAIEAERILIATGSGEKLFAGMHRNAAAAADFLRLPTNRVVELGSKVEI